MKLYTLCLCLFLGFIACTDNNTDGTNNAGDTTLQDPATVHPPSETIPDSMHLKNDSVIVPDASIDTIR